MITVRWATETDAAAIAALGFFEQSTEFGSELATFMRDHADSHNCAVALDGDRLIAMAWLAVVSRVPRPGISRRSGFQAVFVEAPYRLQGIAARLMQLIDGKADELGLVHQSGDSSTAGLPLYTSQGFISSGKLLRKPGELER